MTDPTAVQIDLAPFCIDDDTTVIRVRNVNPGRGRLASKVVPCDRIELTTVKNGATKDTKFDTAVCPFCGELNVLRLDPIHYMAISDANDCDSPSSAGGRVTVWMSESDCIHADSVVIVAIHDYGERQNQVAFSFTGDGNEYQSSDPF